mgnify:CR=1 FL=1
MGTFKDVVGHKDIINYIRNAVREDKVSHAYILNGERGAGKKMLANLFAATLLCEKGGPDPCNECHSCRQAESGNHPDIIKVTHEKPNSISVDDIREQVNNTIMIKPYQGPYKVYIIPQADMMTPQGAECPAENDRGAAGICGDLVIDGECGSAASDDPFPMCDAQASEYQRPACQKNI